MSDVGAVGEGAKTDEEKVMADSGVAATVSVSLHPLVIMNISEHWTRSVFNRHSVLCNNRVSQDQGPGGKTNAGVRSFNWETER